MTNGAARHVVIDCDPGTDDAIALWLALEQRPTRLNRFAVGLVGQSCSSHYGF